MSSEKLKEKQQSLSKLWQNFDWEQTREGVNRESRARILLLGLPGAGKSTLFNQLCGWTVSTPNGEPTVEVNSSGTLAGPIEDFGLFCLVDLPQELGDYSSRGGIYNGLLPNSRANGPGQDNLYGLGMGFDGLDNAFPLGTQDPLALAEGADLLVYVLDGAAGVRAADYRWVGRLRRLGAPLLVVLNKSDLLTGDLTPIVHKTEVEERLATTVLPVSALTGTGVSDELLPKMMNTCPNLTVALGRELRSFRSQAAKRLIYRTAMLNGLVSLEPIPLLDLPIQIMTLTGLMLRLAAVYDRPAADGRRREAVFAVAGGLIGRYGAQQLAKLVPVVGWLISGFVGWSATWALGRAAIAYFEADGDAVIDRNLNRAKNGMSQVCQSVYRGWQCRPRLRLEQGQSEPATAEQEEK